MCIVHLHMSGVVGIGQHGILFIAGSLDIEHRPHAHHHLLQASMQTCPPKPSGVGLSLVECSE